MPFRFAAFHAVTFIIIWFGSISDSNTRVDEFKPISSNLNPIKVRESTTDLQVAVADKIFVFGKAKGTLDKVKVGMHVLPFSQETAQNENTFSKVSWKKLKDGSIQIQSSYSPWPNFLTWTVYADGQLKMEASAPTAELLEPGLLSLGFNFPDQSLNQVSWNYENSEVGQWKNQNFTPMSDPSVEIRTENPGIFEPIQTVKLEFEDITLAVRTEAGNTFFGLGKFPNRQTDYPRLISDLIFLFNQLPEKTNNIPQSPSGESVKSAVNSKAPLVLWFYFQ